MGYTYVNSSNYTVTMCVFYYMQIFISIKLIKKIIDNLNTQSMRQDVVGATITMQS